MEDRRNTRVLLGGCGGIIFGPSAAVDRSPCRSLQRGAKEGGEGGKNRGESMRVDELPEGAKGGRRVGGER